MRKWIALLWGGLSAAAGVLSIWPSISPYRREKWALAQQIATEDPGLGLMAGVMGLWQGLRAGNRRAVLLSMTGITLRLRPWMQRDGLIRAQSDAMRQGLGHGWQRDIPAQQHHAFPQQHRADWSGPLRHLLTARVQVTRDVLYAAPNGQPLRLDVVEPAHAAGPRPAVVMLHGGAWFQGDKGRYLFGWQNRWLAGQGYVVFDVQYRLGERWPAPMADVRCAIRWIKANADRYHVDPEHVVLFGRAAGAHLALMAAYTVNDPRFPGGCFGGEDHDDSVTAVIASAPPTDLRLWPAEPDSAIAALLGGLPDAIPDAYALASPVTHIKPGLPPTLLIQGQRDRTVRPAHSELLTNLLRGVGVPVVLLRTPWGRHGVDGLPVGLAGPLVQYDIDRFLAWACHAHSSQETHA